MKSIFLRPAILLALALGLSACGGKASFEIKGVIEGLKYDDVTLTEKTSGQKITIKAPATASSALIPFSFPNTLEYGAVYDVAVATEADQPDHQNCTIPNFTDTAGRLSDINVVVRCTIDAHRIFGSITGDATGLELVNGSNGKFIVTASTVTSYQFSDIPYDTSYSIAILKQPTSGKVCSLSGAPVAGIMRDADIEIKVSCV